MPSIYIGVSLDVLHHGHINLIEKASAIGSLTVGLLTEKAISNHKRLPFLTFEQRKKILENIKGVSTVVPQDDWDYSPNLLKYKPDIMVHGDDWTDGPAAPYRKLALEALSQFGGKLLEIPHTRGMISSSLAEHTFPLVTTSDIRRSTLKRLLNAEKLVRLLEAHSPLSALIAEKASVEKDGLQKEFDGFWSSSLTDSTEMRKPDIEALSVSQRLNNINDIFDVTTKPLIMDADTGGKIEHLEINVRSMDRLGISAVIIEDKAGLKKNSLFGNEVFQEQEDIQIFSQKIRAARAAVISEDFMIIARIESLILENGLEDALTRADAYVNAGVDGVMIHSRKKKPDEVIEFASKFRQRHPFVPLVAVPTSYNKVTEGELETAGFNVVIYANQLLRASYPAMKSVALSILEHGRSHEADSDLIAISEILGLIPGTR